MPAIKNSSNTNAVISDLKPTDDEVTEAVKASKSADLAKGEQAVQEAPKDEPAQG